MWVETSNSDGSKEKQARHDRLLTIAEAVLLSVVTILAAWSGYAAAKWGTESSLDLAHASTARTNASRAEIRGVELRNFDSSTFQAWFTAYIAGNEAGMEVAARRFRPEFKVAFDAWQRAEPAGPNANQPSGPTFMPEYKQPDLDLAARLDTQADAQFLSGARDASNSDDYVRTTVFLAGVLFLVGISSHFAVRGVRRSLVVLGSFMLLAAIVQLILLPRPSL